MGGLLRSALFAMKRLTTEDIMSAATTTAAPAATRCGTFMGNAKELLEVRWLNLRGIIS
jgi:hypothetical protein